MKPVVNSRPGIENSTQGWHPHLTSLSAVHDTLDRHGRARRDASGSLTRFPSLGSSRADRSSRRENCDALDGMKDDLEREQLSESQRAALMHVDELVRREKVAARQQVSDALRRTSIRTD